ncbi:MAG TPA: TRAP transporter small permease [Desulfatiglandales bacterium]|nr:TRAP transporter small permease [Desulfatiglandales bacterium]
MSDLKLLNKARVFLDRLTSILVLITAWSTLIGMFLICTTVGSRYVFGYSVPGTMDISQIILVLIIFIPLVYVEKTGGHLKISIIASRYSKRTESIRALISNILTAIVFGLMSYMSMIGCITSFLEHEDSWGDIAIPLCIPKFFIFLGCLLFSLYTLGNLLFQVVDYIKTNGEPSKK